MEEKERKRQGGTQQLCQEKCFQLEINKKQERKEGTRELRRQKEDTWMTKIPTIITPPLDQNNI